MRILFTCILFILFSLSLVSQDTLTIVSYNVLNYGDGCQGSNSTLHRCLKTITAFTKPDVLGMVKMTAVKRNTSDANGALPIGFADSIIVNTLNPAVPANNYSYCTFTNESGDSKMSVLFYNAYKLSFISTTTLVADVSDFNLYKLYYKDPHLSSTKDTTFLYIVLNHTQSGTDATIRNRQESSVLQAIQNRYYKLPNILIMGDFNLHNSSEQFYQNYIAATDTNFKLYDAPFTIDNKLSYPIDWDNNPQLCPAYLTTSTRQSASIPNSCGTSGGAKSWYDHILISPWIKNKTNYISYVPNSYHTIGNDGNRLGTSINDSTIVNNTSAPSAVINALFQLSNKYPISIKLALQSNTTSQSPADPDKIATVTGILKTPVLPSMQLVNPITNTIQLYFSSELQGQTIAIKFIDVTGKIVLEKEIIANSQVEIHNSLPQGLYQFLAKSSKGLLHQQKIIKY